MANSDIENSISEFESSHNHVSASTTSTFRDLKSPQPRQDRAPLEISNTSNCVPSNQALNPAANKTRDEVNGRAAEGHYQRMPTSPAQRDEESMDVDARQRRGWAALHSRQEEDDDIPCSFFSNTFLPSRYSEFDRQAVDSVQDNFRELCAPKQQEHADFFQEIIDVDREVGFGEDEDFAGQQNEDNNDFPDTLELQPIDFHGRLEFESIDSHRELEFQPNDFHGEHSTDEEVGMVEGHLQLRVEEVSKKAVPECREELVECHRNNSRPFVRSSSTVGSARPRAGARQFMRSSSTVGTARPMSGTFKDFQTDKFVRSNSITGAGRARSGAIEGLRNYHSGQEPVLRRSRSNQFKDFSSVESSSRSEKHRWDKIDSSVDLREAVDKEWPTLMSEAVEEEIDSEQSQREWEMRNREVQLDEEVGMWMDKAGRVEQERTSADVGKDYPLQKSENMDEVIRDLLAELRQESGIREKDESLNEDPVRTSLVLATIGKRHSDNTGNPYSLIIMAFEDLLREAQGKADRDRKTLEDVLRNKEESDEVMRQQHMRWSETEKELEGRINSLEMQYGRLSDMLRETAVALTDEKERRKESRAEVDRILEMLKKERKSHHETLEKLNTCVNSLMKLRGNLAMQKSRSAEDGGPSYLQIVETFLRDMDRELQINLNHLTRKSTEAFSDSSDVDELSRWKQQRDALEAERDKVEENMSLLLKRTRERHGEMEALWLERETLLEQKVGCLEVELQYSQMKQRRKEAEILTERQRWAEELEKCRQAWAHERTTWEETVKVRKETVEERDETLGGSITMWDLMPKALKQNSPVAKVAEIFQGPSSDDSDYGFEAVGKMGNEIRGLQDVARKGRTLHESDAIFDDKINQFCVDVGNLALGMEAGVERVTEDLRSREHQWELEKMQWKETEESLKKERQEMEMRVSASLASMEEMKMEMKAKEAQIVVEKKEMQALMLEKVAEVERLKGQLKSKEHDLEVTVQKFMDEVRLIDKEVEKERKEREQVMELHFASKRKVVMDMKEREERWEKEVEAMSQELDNAKIQTRSKEKEIEELKRASVRAPSERERQLTKTVSSLQHEKDALAAEFSKEKGEVRRAVEEMLGDVWKVCEEEQIQAAVAKRLGPGEELSLQRPMWESIWQKYCKNKGISDNSKSVERDNAPGKEISDATSVIENLREELKVKEKELLEAKVDREKEWGERERDSAQEQGKVIKLLESQQQNERKLVLEWEAREQELLREKEAMDKLYKMEQDESSETISNLQGAVRELEWVLKQSKSDLKEVRADSGTVVKRGLIQSVVKNAELVKVHASYLEEVDQYIRELEAKMEASEKNLRNPGQAFALKDGRQDPEMNLALMKIERELFSSSESKGHLNLNSSDDDGSYFSPRSSREWGLSGHVVTGSGKRAARRRGLRPLQGSMCLTLNGLSTLAQDTWSEGADEHFPLWQFEGRTSVNSIKSWMSQTSSTTEDLYTSHELPAHGVLTLPSSNPPTPFRRQQKWVVDASWLEQVRKEHAWLRQQLEIERQRVSALGRVEADNQWIEAAIIRALELKRESESKVADMQRKVNIMEVLMSKTSTSSC